MSEQPYRPWLTFLDLETTGLEEEHCVILEIGIKVTDEHLVTQGQYHAVIHYDDLYWLGGDNDWARNTHSKNGLLAEVAASSKSLSQVEQEVVEFLTEMGSHPLAGNSCHFDRRFLAEHMPDVLDYIRYRHVDVSSLVELSKRWRPDLSELVPKSRELHRSIPDLEDSVAALRFYKEQLFSR